MVVGAVRQVADRRRKDEGVREAGQGEGARDRIALPAPVRHAPQCPVNLGLGKFAHGVLRAADCGRPCRPATLKLLIMVRCPAP